VRGFAYLRQPIVIKGLNSWRLKWRNNGWVRKFKKGEYIPVPNADLWRELDALASVHTIRGEWVRGHSGHPENERCDELAEAEAARYANLAGAIG
jgi:ribonuclease HI